MDHENLEERVQDEHAQRLENMLLVLDSLELDKKVTSIIWGDFFYVQINFDLMKMVFTYN